MSQDKEEVEIDLLELAKKLWDNKKFIIKASVIGAVVGIVIAFSIPKEYTTAVILTTESGQPTGGGMGALASMAGINIGGGSGSEMFSPELYPIVLNSTLFVQGLLNINVVDEEQDINTTLYNYLKDEQKSAWWSYILKTPRVLLELLSSKKSDNPTLGEKSRYIAKEEMDIIESLRSSSAIDINKKSGIITIEYIAQSPVISAFLVDTLTSYLQSYIIEQRTKKAKMDLADSEKLCEQAKLDYYKSQQSLASFIDANKNVISAKYKISQEKLQNETTLTYSVYNQMAQQVQMNKIKVQNETPVFTIIQPAIEPLYASTLSKKVVTILFIFLTVIGASVWVLRKDLLKLITIKR